MNNGKASVFLEPPTEMVCPLTKELMKDPVMSRYGTNFEREAILDWLGEGNEFCPVTGKPLRPSCLVSNKALEWKIRCWLHEHGREAPPEHHAPELDDSFRCLLAVTPQQYICPLTKSLMKDPVMTHDGHNFERNAILQHLDDHGDICPITGKPLVPHDLVTNLGLKHEIHIWHQRIGDEDPEISDDSDPKLDSPKPALVGVRGDHAVEVLRARHTEFLKESGMAVESEDFILEPFSATAQIDDAKDTHNH